MHGVRGIVRADIRGLIAPSNSDKQGRTRTKQCRHTLGHGPPHGYPVVLEIGDAGRPYAEPLRELREVRLGVLNP